MGRPSLQSPMHRLRRRLFVAEAEPWIALVGSGRPSSLGVAAAIVMLLVASAGADEGRGPTVHLDVFESGEILPSVDSMPIESFTLGAGGATWAARFAGDRALPAAAPSVLLAGRDQAKRARGAKSSPVTGFRARSRDLFRAERPLQIGEQEMVVRLRLRVKARRAMSLELRF